MYEITAQSPLLWGSRHGEAVTEGLIFTETKNLNNRRCALTPPPATFNREPSPHQSLRDSFSSRRSRLYAHIASTLGENPVLYAEDGGVQTGGMRAYRPTHR